LDQDDRVVRIELFQVVVDGDAAGGRDMGVCWLVRSLPGPEARMALEGVDDLVEQCLVSEVVVDAGQRQPELEPVRGRRVELLRDRDQLLVETGPFPDRVVAKMARTGACDLGPGIAPVRRGAAERRRIGEPEREDALAVDEQVPSCRVDRASSRRQPPARCVRLRPA
jgi:hypothetical protein